MKIISCHIENFGKLHDYTINFSEGLNTICAENGWGKSTFAAFVRAMFYGLDGERKRSIEENERKHYAPWQGGVFGGQLVFETDEKTYQIIRIFKDKDINDEFELRDAKTNLVSKDYSKNIGEELFKINRESFIRTIFMGQNDCETIATDDINAKIGNLTDNANDLSNFDAAYARLTDLINSMTPNRVTGALSKRKEEIARLERVVQDGKEIGSSMDSYQELLHAEEKRYESLKKEMNAAGELQSKVSGLQKILAKKEEWERLKGAAEEKAAKVKDLEKGFPGEIPASEGMKGVIEDCSHMDKAYERMISYELSEQELTDEDSLQIVFGAGIPDNEEIDERIKQAGMLRQLNQQHSEEKMSSSERLRLEELEPYFDGEQKSVNLLMSKWSTRMAKQAALPSSRMALATLQATEEAAKGNAKEVFSPLLVVGIVSAIISIVLANFWNWLPGAIVGAISIVLLIAVYIREKRNTLPLEPEVSPQMEAMLCAIQEEERFIEEVDEEVASYLAEHDREFEEYSASGMLQEIAAEAIEYSGLKKKAIREAESNVSEEIGRLREELYSYLRGFGVLTNEFGFVDELYSLKAKAGRFLALQKKREKYREAEEIYVPLRLAIRRFLENHGYVLEENTLTQLYQISEKIDAYQEAGRGLAEVQKQLKGFEQSTDISKLMQTEKDEDLTSLEAINQTILQITEDMEVVHSTILSYNKSLDGLQEQYDEWEESRLRLEVLREMQDVELKKYNYLVKARLKLGLAKEALTAKYAEPIMEQFCKYFAILTKDTAEKFHMDANTNVTIDEFGKQREINTLSAGYKDLVGICLRLALIEVMYSEEVPPIIMDDPFINLDDAKLEEGRTFLKEIAGKYQIIYFTCSNSRSYNT